jgi:carboxypeptidase PM20D1
MKRAAKALGLLLVLLGSVLVIRTLNLRSRQIAVEPAAPLALDESALVSRLSRALQLKTVSKHDQAEVDHAEFAKLRELLQTSYPKMFAAMPPERVGQDALLLRWPGSDEKKAPVLLLAHQDVVPVEPGTEAQWSFPPWDGKVDGGYVWGRGAIDDKASLLALCEAVERLLADGFRPKGSIYFGFGADEEVSGHDGAVRIAELLKTRGVMLDWVLDEGMAPTQGIVPGVDGLVASVGVAEKGYLSLELTAKGPGGHSSMPPPRSTAGTLAHAVARLEDHPMPASTGPLVRRYFQYLGPEMSFDKRLVFANLWLFAPLVRSQLAKSPTTDAFQRTTTAVTMLSSGVKDNVLPQSAKAVVNFRIYPGESSASVIDHVKRTVADDTITVAPGPGHRSEPSPISSADSASFEGLHKTIRAVFPGAIVAPSVMLGASDSRYFSQVTRDTYRFFPWVLRPGDPKRIHGTDERLSVSDYLRGVRFYHALLKAL